MDVIAFAQWGWGDKIKCFVIVSTSTSLTAKSGECDRHRLLKVSEFELEPLKLQSTQKGKG